jgi:hypothetical protein
MFLEDAAGNIKWLYPTDSAALAAVSFAVADAYAPVVTANNLSLAAGQSVALSSIFSVSGTGITQYQVWFSWPDGGAPALGTLTNNGTAVPLDRPVTFTDIRGLVYTGANTAGTDRIWLQAYNGSWSNNGQWTEADIKDQGLAAPVVTANNLSVAAGQSVSLSSIFSISGSAITQYQVWFSWPDGGAPALGTLTNNGAAVPLDRPLTFTDISGLVYTGSSTAGTDKIWLQAYNGSWSNNGQWVEADITDRGSSGGAVSSQTESLAVEASKTLEITSAFAGTVAFAADSGTLKLDNSASFAGTVAGMIGQDTIDFADIDFNKVHQPGYSGDASGGMLTVTDGTHTASR